MPRKPTAGELLGRLAEKVLAYIDSLPPAKREQVIQAFERRIDRKALSREKRQKKQQIQRRKG